MPAHVMVDIDDVLVEFYSEMIESFNGIYGTRVAYGDLRSYNFSEIFRRPIPEMQERVMQFHQETAECGLPAVPEAESTMLQLQRLGIVNKFIMISARPESIRTLTRDLLLKAFPSKILDKSEMFLLDHYQIDDGVKQGAAGPRCKSQFCHDLKISWAVEDSDFHARAIARTGRTVFLLSRPWNQRFCTHEFNVSRSDDMGFIIRVSSWKDILWRLTGGSDACGINF